MFKKMIAWLLLLSLLVILGCAAHVHTIGKGPQKFVKQEARQWYILFGLVPLNHVDTNAMSIGAADYEIRTATTALDVVMNIFTGYITINSRTVTVTQ
ncbi:hypothetical protein L0128_01460 [candidate division KSB1 bacterium]|nr:hypothetical protein [candidate division KSB1 bacterium]